MVIMWYWFWRVQLLINYFRANLWLAAAKQFLSPLCLDSPRHRYEDTGSLLPGMPMADPRGSLTSTHHQLRNTVSSESWSACRTNRRWYTALLGHIAQFADSVPADLALRCQIDASVGCLPSHNWKHCPGCTRNSWLDLDWQDSNCSSADKRWSIMVMVWEWRYGRHRLCGHGDADGGAVPVYDLLKLHCTGYW